MSETVQVGTLTTPEGAENPESPFGFQQPSLAEMQPHNITGEVGTTQPITTSTVEVGVTAPAMEASANVATFSYRCGNCSYMFTTLKTVKACIMCGSKKINAVIPATTIK